MRTFVLILTLYANTVAPWWCCCSVSRASASWASPAETEPAKPSCTAKCCQDADLKPSHTPDETPPNQRPCPVQERLILERPTANLDRVDLDLKTYFAELTQAGANAYEMPDEGPLVQSPPVGTVPTLLMAELRLRFHHVYLC